MNNIYDIISEQKILVDTNINSYEMLAINESFSILMSDTSYDYIEEGLSDIANKVVAFIKSMLAKLQELVNKVINYFRGKQQNKGDILQSVASKAKKEITREDIIRIVKGSQKKVNAIKYAALPVKQKISNDVLNAVYSVSELFTSDKNDVNKQFKIMILKKAFKGNGAYTKNKEIDIVERTKLEIGEPTEQQEYKIADLADEIISYSIDINKITGDINKLHNQAKDSLNKLIKKVESISAEDKASISQVQGVTTMTGQFVNYICTSIVTSYNQYEKLALAAVEDHYNKGESTGNSKPKEEPAKPNNDNANNNNNNVK